MDGRNNSGNNKPLSLYSDAEITELAKKMAVNNSQFTEEDYIKLIKSSYVPKERKVVRIDQKHDVIYYAEAEEDEIKELEKSPKQFGSSTGQIYDALHDSSNKKSDEFNKFNDFFLSRSSREPIHIHKEEENRIVLVEPIERDNRPMQRIATVLEKTPGLASEEYERYSSFNPK